jgi:hypothetical protein
METTQKLLQHLPLQIVNFRDCANIVNSRGEYLGEMMLIEITPEIVRACNAHYELLDRLKETNEDLKILVNSIRYEAKRNNRFEGVAEQMDVWIASNAVTIAKAQKEVQP